MTIWYGLWSFCILFPFWYIVWSKTNLATLPTKVKAMLFKIGGDQMFCVKKIAQLPPKTLPNCSETPNYFKFENVFDGIKQKNR
jgi:hypothetical protein